MRIIRNCVLLFATLLCVKGQSQNLNPRQRLDSLFEAYHEYVLQQYPESATFNGDHRYDDRSTDYSAKARSARLAMVKLFVSTARSIKDSSLSAKEKLNRDLFIFDLQKSIDAEKFNSWMIPLSQQGGLHLSLPLLAENTRFENEKDFENYLRRLNDFPKQVDLSIEAMKQGMKAKIVPTKVVMQRVETQLQRLCETKVEDLDLFKIPLKRSSKAPPNEVQSPSLSVTDGTQNLPRASDTSISELKLRDALSKIMRSYRKLLEFVRTEYLPKCRNDVGEWSLPNGIERYNFVLQDHTSLSISADEVFELGNKEVARISKLMEKLKRKMGFGQSLSEFHAFLRKSPQFYYSSKEELLEKFSDILSKATAQLPALFHRLPKTECQIKELESFRSEAAPQAYYYSAPEDGSRPGYFYVNTYNLPARPMYTMTALTLHEAVPGHHLQISLAQEDKDMPWFRRQMSVTAYVEGWALYAERLGYDMGLYSDPYQQYGALGFEMWRACRLVVDAGLHAKKWSREQAIDFMMKYTVNSEADIISEVERYIAWPGQACAYKIGQLKILELRAKAEKELAQKFSLPDFHDMILENGAIPLPILEKVVDEWIAKRK